MLQPPGPLYDWYLGWGRVCIPVPPVQAPWDRTAWRRSRTREHALTTLSIATKKSKRPQKRPPPPTLRGHPELKNRSSTLADREKDASNAPGPTDFPPTRSSLVRRLTRAWPSPWAHQVPFWHHLGISRGTPLPAPSFQPPPAPPPFLNRPDPNKFAPGEHRNTLARHAARARHTKSVPAHWPACRE